MLKKIKIASPCLLVSLSALASALPFLIPSLWWLIFLFPLPLFLATTHTNLGFRHGFMWGIIAYSLQLYDIYTGVARMAAGPTIYPFLLVASLVCGLAFYSGIWFWGTN